MTMALAAFLLLQASSGSAVIDNQFVRVFKNSAPCASAGAGCGERVIVALGTIQLGGQKMDRGAIKVFKTGERYAAPTGGDFVEVAWKPNHPRPTPPPVAIEPEKNSIVYDGERYFVFNELLQPGDTRGRHSHSDRVVVRLNATRLQQWPDGAPEVFRDQVPDSISFNEPAVHIVKNVGAKPLHNIVIELKP
jgi:hypothetical protein